MKPSFVTWQLRRLHDELDAIENQLESGLAPGSNAGGGSHALAKERAARRILIDRLLRALPRQLGYRNARAFAAAFNRANHLTNVDTPMRKRLSPQQVRELERRVMENEPPAEIARAIGCAKQTVLNRASQLRKRLSNLAERDSSGI